MEPSLRMVNSSKTDPKDYRELYFWVNQRIGDKELEKKSLSLGFGEPDSTFHVKIKTNDYTVPPF